MHCLVVRNVSWYQFRDMRGHSTGQQEFIISLFGSWMSKTVRSSSPRGNWNMAHCLRHASMITSIKFTTQDEASVGDILCCLVPNEEGIWRQKVKDIWKKNGKKKVLRNIEYPRTKLKRKGRLIYRASYLSPWSTALFWELILSQPEKKVSVCDVNCLSTNVFTGSNLLSLSRSRCMHHTLFLDSSL